MFLKLILVCLILQGEYSRIKSQESPKKQEKDVFLATYEWKEIKEGQKVPSGLHYRINLSTGKKEAKIIEDDIPNSKNSFVIVNKGNNKKETIRNKETIEILKDEAKEIKTRYRSIEELKKELGDLKLNSKTDAEIMFDLFSEFEEVTKKREVDTKSVLSILEDLIYLSHQIDNANEFVRLNGFPKIVYKNLNSTDDDVIKDTLKLFSSLVQNNSKVKVHALESGAISKLLKILNLNNSPKIQYSTLTALSCLLRTFPFAQNKFIEMGGVNIFSEMFSSSNTKVKLKIVTLIDDLLNERENDAKNFEGHEVVDLKNILHKLNWCTHLIKLLSEVFSIDINDHDSIEKCLTAMSSMKDQCGEAYSKDILININLRYDALTYQTIEEDYKDYYGILRDLTSVLIANNQTSFKSNIKQEF